jgi:hypothetical protein
MKRSLSAVPAAQMHGRYELKAEVARGGMGVVYRAFDRLGQREVAYKRLLTPESRSSARYAALFQREYNTLAQLEHPAIVDVYEYGFDEVGPFYTMELLDGKGLMELAPLPAREVCRVLRDIASALALLHARRMLHRDLSPGNVRVSSDGRAKLLDFGALIPFGVAPDVMGTPAFMAPESFEGAVLDQRADLYALGALAYWALTRKTAVSARSLADLPMAWLDPIVPPSRHAPGMPQSLEDLVLSLLARDPLARPATAAEVMERLSTIGELDAEPEEHEVALSYIAHPPLVGRDTPLRHIRRALGGLTSKQGASLLVEADPGQGKSALLHGARLRAQFEGATVLHVDAAAENSSFGVARALVRVVTALYPDLMTQAGKKDSLFEQVLEPRRLARVEAWSPVVASERQARTLLLMQEMLLRAADRNALVILVDELHRADNESLALLATLADECQHHSLLLVLAANRNVESSEAYVKIATASRQFGLKQLDPQDCQELMHVIFGDADNCQRLAAFLFEQTQGNPAGIMDMMRLLLRRKLIHYTTGTFTLPHSVPDDVAWESAAAALMGRLADLTPLAQRAASALALQEMPVAVAHLAAVLSVETPQLVPALDDLSGRSLVSMTDGRAALLSASLRDAIASNLAEESRRELHLRTARVLLADPQCAGTLRMHAGVHLLKAGEETEAVATLMRRGDGDFLSGDTPIPLLESVLAVLRKHGRTDEQCLSVLVPLVRGGFFGEFKAQQRHIEPALRALANVTGVSRMHRLTPLVGKKVAFAFGLVGALVKHARTPRDMRIGTFPETVAALLSILSSSVASCVSAFDTKQAFEILRMFEPLRGFGSDSAPCLGIEFCLATAELGAGRYSDARLRYRRLLDRFQRPVKGMDEQVHAQFRSGILHGMAQCMVADTDPECLKVADELERDHVFFAPHAQTVRMGFYAYRGEMERALEHKRSAEMLALRGGISWSSVTVMTLRIAYMAASIGDVVGIMRAISEFDRLTAIAPNAALHREAMQAALELYRGRAQRAVDGYERLFAKPESKHMMTRNSGDRGLYAKALAAVGRHAESKQVCEAVLADCGPHEFLFVKKGAMQQLALTEAAMGNIQRAEYTLDDVVAKLKPMDNAMWSGMAHRDRAKVALVANDHTAFKLHAQLMNALLQRTKNPTLIQQCDQLTKVAHALSLGSQAMPPLDETAIAFETAQSQLCTADDMEGFTTEDLPSSSSANDNA